MNQVIEKARKRLAALEIEAEQIRQFIHMYEKLAREEFVGEEATQWETRGGTALLPGVAVEKSSPAQIVAAAKELMKEKQRPLTRSELVRLLSLRGLRISGVDKSKNVGTIMWRSKEFENVEGRGYWPKELGPWSDSVFSLIG